MDIKLGEVHSVENAIKEWKTIRRNNKNTWIFFYASIQGKSIYCKSYDTSIQRAGTVNGIVYSGTCDCKVSEALETLQRAWS